MTALLRDQINTPAGLNWFITVRGVPRDAYAIGYQIWDVTAGYPGAQIFPVAAGEFEDVTSGPGHYGTGAYYAYNNTAAHGYTVPADAAYGTHAIKWRWKVSGAAAYQTGTEEFEVVATSSGATSDLYCAVQDIRDLGVTIQQVSDDRVLACIALAQELLERATRQWFAPRVLQFKFDGSDSDAIHFSVPIISIDWLKLNEDLNYTDASIYKVYNGRSYPDDRHNPRIKLVGAGADLDIYTAPIISGRIKFRKGRQNQEVRGVFGYVEESGDTPLAIKEATARMALERMAHPAYGAAPIYLPSPPVSGGGAVIDESTDGHRLAYATAPIKPQKVTYAGVTTDPFVLDVIKLYRAPIGIATPGHWTYT